MRKLQIILTEEQYQNILAEPNYGKRDNLDEETFGDYELCPHGGRPDFFPATLDIHVHKSIALGEVKWGLAKTK